MSNFAFEKVSDVITKHIKSWPNWRVMNSGGDDHYLEGSDWRYRERQTITASL